MSSPNEKLAEVEDLVADAEVAWIVNDSERADAKKRVLAGQSAIAPTLSESEPERTDSAERAYRTDDVRESIDG